MTRVELMEAETLAMTPEVLPHGWSLRSDIAHGAYDDRGVSVIWSVERIDGQVWRHLSVATTSGIPSYTMMAGIKRWLLGDEGKAIMVFPPRSEHINIHQHCLHLWEPVGHDPLPDFRREGGL